MDAVGIEEIGRALSPGQALGGKLLLDVGISETWAMAAMVSRETSGCRKSMEILIQQ